MKKVLPSLAVLLLVVAVAAPANAGESAWFDMENCSMCKHLSAETGLLDNIGWDHYMIANGMITVTTVPAEYEESMARAAAKMEKTGQELMSGTQMELCGFCNSMGAILATGKAHMEQVETKVAEISLITSSDPAVIEMIHEHGKRIEKEMAHMQEHGAM